MRGKFLYFAVLFLFVMTLLVGCANAPATETAEPQPPAETAVVEATPTPEPEPEPLLCNIAFDSDRDGNREIYVMGPDGSNPTNLTNNPADDSDPVWSPDGNQIAFVSNRVNDTDGGQFIYVMDADGNNVRQLTQENESKYPDWSNDGKLITYSHQGDIYLIKADGSGESINLTNSPEEDAQSTISTYSTKIAWLSGGDGNWNLFVMNLDNSDLKQLSDNGKVTSVEWTVDGQILAFWDHPEGLCGKCVMNANGSDVKEAGGKGELQQYLPFWTPEGERVECVSIDLQKDFLNEIYLVSGIYPDIFFNLTNHPADDRNPDWPANCGPASGTAAAQPATGEQPGQTGDLVIGYEGDINEDYPKKLSDLKKACDELRVSCVRGDNIAALMEQDVDAILSFSNKWNVLGSWPQIHEAAEAGIPLFILDAESGEQGVYNLSVHNESLQSTLAWMFKKMGGSGEFVYYNFGPSDYDQSIIDQVLKEFPGIQATSLPASYDGESFTEASISELVNSKPNLGAIWTNENLNAVFWGLKMVEGDKIPATICSPRMDILEPWQERLQTNPSFECISTIKPGGTGYEAVYVAYYLLTGKEIDPAALGGAYGNTFRYDYPLITSDNLDEWLAKAGSFREGNYGMLELPPMSPEEILEKWFLE